MELQDLYKTGHSFEMEGKKITFNMIAWGDAIKAQNAIYLVATNQPDNIDEGNARLLKLALKYTTIETENGEIQSPLIENFASQFQNPLACIELSAQFQSFIGGFLERLPTFQKQKGV